MVAVEGEGAQPVLLCYSMCCAAPPEPAPHQDSLGQEEGQGKGFGQMEGHQQPSIPSVWHFEDENDCAQWSKHAPLFIISKNGNGGSSWTASLWLIGVYPHSKNSLPYPSQHHHLTG